MKKIGIITICDNHNYGNRLQNYATQELLTSLGCEPETIVNRSPSAGKGDRLGLAERVIRAIRTPVPVLIDKIRIKIRGRLIRRTLQQLQAEKVKVNERFTAVHIRETSFHIGADDIPEGLADRYDYFVVGSDQVWNPNFRHGSPIDFLRFAPPGKRIALAPSFGISSIPERYAATYKKWLSEMAWLSVREHSGAAIIKTLTGRDAEVLVDPTLMLTPGQWRNVARPAAHKPAGKYLFTYFLGEVSGNRNRLIEKIARDHRLEVVRIASLQDKPRYVTDVAGFIDYIRSAEIIMTDSFHGAVFSILFERPFVVFYREGKSAVMSSRIDTLLSKFGLESRKISEIKETGDYFRIDYSHVSPLLEKERSKTRAYLIKAMNLEPISHI